ncbi:protein translocase subunit SecF [Candidatus Kaiserbacteria bacterium CG10_big_fil_rev_8_21_14_0_10_47_16]|uniref:Protein-export membrane protein SecF n=1 Tax=Candidatus Kaiserbacteria bacterium CG10_big_fil_rev_8_21_14_0_10_47_16 TaxID=1974608 RepID=A0A2H0UE22_9BACT|nr:MAG: protein translocase subunit SecF [Candidatus Kaiserbacteria bacterium CG10_big_fil_rev_8_21_14_0_10_47_16]
MFIAKYTKQLLIITVLIFVVTIGTVATLGIPFGIDFTGGALTEVSYESRPSKADLQTALNTEDLGDYSLREATTEDGKSAFILRTRDLTESERQEVGDVLTSVGEGGTISRFTSIGPVIGEELATKAAWAIVAVVFIIVIYIAFVFRKVANPVRSWVYGGIVILVLIHDVLVPAAVMSLLGYFLGAEADVLFIMALLAVLGYSVNDTIVVFDRVRENLLLSEGKNSESFPHLVGRSVQEAMARSINTSVTTLAALSALYFLGGDVTKNFALVLIAGVIAGAYSSICIANPLLIYIAEKQK